MAMRLAPTDPVGAREWDLAQSSGARSSGFSHRSDCAGDDFAISKRPRGWYACLNKRNEDLSVAYRQDDLIRIGCQQGGKRVHSVLLE